MKAYQKQYILKETLISRFSTKKLIWKVLEKPHGKNLPQIVF